MRVAVVVEVFVVVERGAGGEKELVSVRGEIKGGLNGGDFGGGGVAERAEEVDDGVKI